MYIYINKGAGANFFAGVPINIFCVRHFSYYW